MYFRGIMEEEYPKWVYLMTKRLLERIPELDSVSHFPYYDKEFKFLGWMFRIVKGNRYVTFMLDEPPDNAESVVQEKIFDFYIKHTTKALEG